MTSCDGNEVNRAEVEDHGDIFHVAMHSYLHEKIHVTILVSSCGALYMVLRCGSLNSLVYNYINKNSSTNHG